MLKVTLPSGKVFESDEGESLLDAAIRAGINLDYSCRTGRCSTCKARVAPGTTRALREEIGLDIDQRRDGWVLSCVRTPITDVALEGVTELDDVLIPKPRTTACRISAIEFLAPDVLRLVLRLPPHTKFDFLPGQYIELIGPSGVRRSYSLAAPKNAEGTLELHVRKVDGGAMSNVLFGDAKVDDLFRVHGPLGTFFLRDVAGLDLVFLATGTGFAPAKAIFEEIAALPEHLGPASMTLYWGARRHEDIYWAAKQINPRLRVVPVLSREDWSGEKGHVQDVYLAGRPDLTHTVVYACGSSAMIGASRAALAAAGLRLDRFHADAFVSSAPAK